MPLLFLQVAVKGDRTIRTVVPVVLVAAAAVLTSALAAAGRAVKDSPEDLAAVRHPLGTAVVAAVQPRLATPMLPVKVATVSAYSEPYMPVAAVDLLKAVRRNRVVLAGEAAAALQTPARGRMVAQTLVAVAVAGGKTGRGLVVQAVRELSSLEWQALGR